MELRRVAEPALTGAAAFVLGGSSVLVFAEDVPVPPPVATVWLAAGIGLAVAVVFVTLVLVLGRGNRAKRELVRAAVRTGRLPDTDEQELHRVLWERSIRLRTWRWSWIAIGAIQLLISLMHLLSRTDTVYSRVFWGLYLVLWVCVIAVWTARAWHERPKVLRLLAELDERMAQRADG